MNIVLSITNSICLWFLSHWEFSPCDSHLFHDFCVLHSLLVRISLIYCWISLVLDSFGSFYSLLISLFAFTNVHIIYFSLVNSLPPDWPHFPLLSVVAGRKLVDLPVIAKWWHVLLAEKHSFGHKYVWIHYMKIALESFPFIVHKDAHLIDLLLCRPRVSR